MALTRSKGNMYKWVTHVWSPIKGCQYECDYCYVKKYYTKTPVLQEKELLVGLGKGKTIFVGHLCDMWGSWIPHDWQEKIVVKCYDYPGNTYIFQSKNPMRFEEFFLGEADRLVGRLKRFPRQNRILGTTIETDDYPKGFHTKAPSIMDRLYSMGRLRKRGEKIFITIEPIMDFNVHNLILMLKWAAPEFVTIGADSKGHGLVEPSWEKVQELIKAISQFTEIRQKTNLERLKYV